MALRIHIRSYGGCFPLSRWPSDAFDHLALFFGPLCAAGEGGPQDLAQLQQERGALALVRG